MTRATQHVQHSDRSVLSDVHEFNLAFLFLVRRIAILGTAQDKLSLGLDAIKAGLMAKMTDQQLLDLARSSLVMSRFALDDHALLSALNIGRESGVLSRARAALSDKVIA